MHDFTKLEVWNRARRLAVDVYRVTDAFPQTETFGLTSQMRRASISVASNIAEGAARGTAKDFARYLRVASGSASEIDTQIRVSVDVGYLGESTGSMLLNEIQEIRDMLFSLERHQTSPSTTT